MNWQPSLSWQDAQRRASVLASIRSFFAQRNVIEVETPILSHGTVTDVHLDAFSTQYDQGDSGAPERLYLQTSPEFAMKRLLAAGYSDIYYLGKSFRHEAIGRHHNAEFTMLEWYRCDHDHFILMVEVNALLEAVLGTPKAEYMTYQQAFINQTGIDPIATNKGDLLSFLMAKGKMSEWLEDESLDTLLQVIFAEFVEPNIGQERPAFVYGFPASQAALARLNREDKRIADRFECYYKGIELANGYHELLDSELHRDRFERDNEIRRSSNMPLKPIDEHFISALEHGLPVCAGVALGVDRLVMLALNKCSIEEVMTFTTKFA